MLPIREQDNILLYKAVDSGDFESVKNIIQAGFDVNTMIFFGKTALYIAAEKGDFEIVKYLTESGADVTFKWYSSEKTVLDIAFVNGNRETVMYLLKEIYQESYSIKGLTLASLSRGGVESNRRSDLFRKAIDNDHIEAVKFLIEIDKKCDTTSFHEITDIIFICKSDSVHFEVIKYLIEIAIAIDDNERLDYFYKASLRYAAENGHLETVKHLKETGFDVDFIYPFDKTSLDIANENGHLGIVAFLTGEVDNSLSASQSLRILESSSFDDNDGNKDTLVIKGDDSTKGSFISDAHKFYAGVAFEKMVIAPGMRLAADKISGKNEDKLIADYWTEQFSVDSLKELSVGMGGAALASFVGANNLNSFITGKMVSDLVHNQFSFEFLSPEYTKSMVASIATACMASSAIYMSGAHHHDNKFIAGIQSSAINSVVGALSHLAIEGYNQMFEEDSYSLYSEL